MKSSLFKALSALSLFSLTLNCFAADLTYHVCPTGNTSNSGTSASSPWPTLNYANNKLRVDHSDYSSPHEGKVTIELCAGYLKPNYITYKPSTDASTGKLQVGRVVRWNFFNARDGVIIKGKGTTGTSANKTVLSGAFGNKPYPSQSDIAGPYLLFDITRDNYPTDSPLNLTIKDLVIQNYFQAAKIRGVSSGYPVDDRVKFESVKFQNIGMAHDDFTDHKDYNEDIEFDPSRGTVYISNSDNNEFTNCLFSNNTNVDFSGRSVSTMFSQGKDYGGYHALYINNSNGTNIEYSSFINVFARGVVKTRNFSNNTRLYRNHFYDDTDSYRDQYCDNNTDACPLSGSMFEPDGRNVERAECPSFGTILSRNKFYHDRSSISGGPLDLMLNTDPRDAASGEYGYRNKPYCDLVYGWRSSFDTSIRFYDSSNEVKVNGTFVEQALSHSHY